MEAGPSGFRTSEDQAPRMSQNELRSWYLWTMPRPPNSYSVRFTPDEADAVRNYATRTKRSIDSAIRVLTCQGLAVEQIAFKKHTELTAELAQLTDEYTDGETK